MSTTEREAIRSALTVTCPDCDAGFEVELAGHVETVDYNPEGVIEATCGQCGEDFAVGFQRKGG